MIRTALVAGLILIASLRVAVRATAESPDLVVQVVDSGWLPIPGIEVTVKRERNGAPAQKKSTDREGRASFKAEYGKGTSYRISAAGPGFVTTVKEHVVLGTQTPTQVAAHVQLQVAVKY